MALTSSDYEKLGAFYLGRRWDLETESASPGPLLYDSRDLLTHAVCVGMTGSGKTGLCVSLLEEAAIDGVPAIAIDPKGDLGNLMLTFPNLEAADFEPWVDAGEAGRKGLSPSEYAARQADLWRNGLSDWGQTGERIAKLRQAADVVIYTPGSEAGVPISILGSLAAPPAEVVADSEFLGDKVSAVASGLLGLLGIDADPVKSREHILLSTILANRWREGIDLDLAALIGLIQEPPFEKLGVLALDSFFPGDDRFELAISFNNLAAAPGMETWTKGQPLDVDRLLYTDEGRPRIAVISIAHLSDAERMFVVSLLLNEIVGWMRSRSGTTSLRALVYLDEVFGFLPPVAEPPSKKPLLTLLKQARAFGLGTVLATQNPADLDYKALSNAGTWFLGRLQTERDKLRVLDGLESASSGATLDRRRIESILSGMGKRVFLLHNVHEPEPVIFHTRWAMSYLRGPLTRNQIKTLMDPVRAAESATAEPAAPARAPASAPPAAAPPAAAPVAARPVLPPEVDQLFAWSRAPASQLEPYALGSADVHFLHKKSGAEHREEILLAAPLLGGEVDWREADEVDRDRWDPERDFVDDPPEGSSFGELPSEAANPKSYGRWRKDLSEILYRDRRYHLLRSATLDRVSEPGEDERAFRIRLSEAAREARDEAVDKLRARYEKKIATMEDRVRRAEQKVEREGEQARQQKMQTWISAGSAVLTAIFGRSSMGRASSAARSATRTFKEGRDVDRAEENLVVQRERLEELEAELEAEVAELEDRFDPLREELETVELSPRRTDVRVDDVRLLWAPRDL